MARGWYFPFNPATFAVHKTASMTESFPVENLPLSLQNLVKAIEGLERFSVNAVRDCLRSVDLPREDLTPWERFEHPGEDSYGRTMIWHGGHYEIMLMSWLPGDISAIHDHGFTQWGAVKVFGNAEHATFLVIDDEMQTLARTMVKSGEVLGVGHQLVHQMGNPLSGEPFVSLHVYGTYDARESITGDARVIDPTRGEIQIVDGGAFFNLPETAIKERKPVPTPDFPTWLRNSTELVRRMSRGNASAEAIKSVTDELVNPDRMEQLRSFLDEIIDENGHTSRSGQWQNLIWELKEAAQLQDELLNTTNKSDHFNTYAVLYDEVIGKPCLRNFMSGYLSFFLKEYEVDVKNTSLLSIGCGTGLVERYMIESLGIPYENLYGMDISAAMIEEARQYIQADVGDALALDPAIRQWEIAYCGLNVFQYIGHQKLEAVIANVARIVKPGGYFIGDFITTDHIRWYPNVIYSDQRDIVSLRTPSLIEKDNHMYQRSQIINVRANDGKLRISYEGEHERFLPPVGRVRQYFEKAFTQVDLYDAVSLQPISADGDTCPSTRYVVVARK